MIRLDLFYVWFGAGWRIFINVLRQPKSTLLCSVSSSVQSPSDRLIGAVTAGSEDFEAFRHDWNRQKSSHMNRLFAERIQEIEPSQTFEKACQIRM